MYLDHGSTARTACPVGSAECSDLERRNSEWMSRGPALINNIGIATVSLSPPKRQRVFMFRREFTHR